MVQFKQHLSPEYTNITETFPMLFTLCQDSYKKSLFHTTYSRCKAVTQLLTWMMQNLHLRKCNGSGLTIYNLTAF